MTEKRFRISQGYTDRFCHDWKKNKLLNFKQTIDCLNTFYEENEQLKSKNRGLQSELQIFKEDATHSNLQINKLADENKHIKQTIKEAYDNERTELGKSVLKQLIEAIQ